MVSASKSVVPDAVALKALTHPVRLRLLSLLRLAGPSTATTLAQRLGLNSGATSYHLRILARHGFIAERPEQGTRRERVWAAQHESTHFRVPGSSPADLESGHAFAQAALTEQTRLMQAAQHRHPDLPPEWQAASDLSDFTMAMTASQAAALRDRLHAVLLEAKAAAPPLDAALPAGHRPIMVVLHSFPYPQGDE